MPLRVTCTLSAYQPVRSGAETEEVVTGAVVSILMPDTDEVLALPALSETLAEAPRLLPSPLTEVFDGQTPLMPESASEQLHATTTLLSYQLFAFGGEVTAPERMGGVWSTLT